jgi:hypothetical protein
VLILKGGQPLFGYFVHFVSLETPAGDEPASSADSNKRASR